MVVFRTNFVNFLELVKDLYIEPAEDRVVRNIFNFVMVNMPVPKKRKKKAAATNATGNQGNVLGGKEEKDA